MTHRVSSYLNVERGTPPAFYPLNPTHMQTFNDAPLLTPFGG